MKHAFLSFCFLLSGFLFAQKSVNGTVTDQEGVPLPGATIVVIETNDGATTDFDGNYSISAADGLTLEISFVGYESQQVVVGADAGASQRSIDFLNLRYGSQHDGQGGFDQNLPTGETFDNDNFIFADISAGLLWFSVFDEDNNFYAGAAFSHLNRANQSFQNDDFEELYSKFTIHAGGEFLVSDRVGLVPGVVTFFQGPSFQLNAGTSLKFLLGKSKKLQQAFQIGAWYRIANHFNDAITSDAFILSTKFDYEQFSIGFSYDVNVSSLRPASNSNGAFEFAMTYKICGPEVRNVYCPNF